jgi:ubiquinone biosynthesis protein
MPGEVLGVLDFGTMGRLDTRDRVNMARMLILLVQYDAEAIVDLLMRMGIASYGVDRTSLSRDVKRLVNKYIGLQIQEIPVNEVIREVEPMVYKYSLRVPSDYLLLFKTVALMQGVGLALDPEFDMLSATRPYLGRLFRQLWSPVNWGPAVLRSVSDWGDLVGSFPRQTTRIMGQLERGDFGIKVDVRDLNSTINRVDRIANRLIYGVLIAAFIVALAFLIPRLDRTWPWDFINWLFIFGFVVMSILGLQLLWSIFRSGKSKK